VTTSETAAVGLPVGVRLRAWWEGYDLADVRRILSRRSAAAVAADTEGAMPDGIADRRPPRSAPADPQAWRPQTIAAGELVFGEGSLSPRGDAQLRALTAPAGLGQRSRILHIGAELGGVAAMLRDGLGCQVVAVETLAELAAASADRVGLLSPGDAPKLAGCDLIVVDGVAERAEPLASLLRNQAAGLAPGGQLVLRSLALVDERAAGSARYRDWSQAEPVRPRLRTSEELNRILQESRLTVTAATWTSDDYADEVERCWGDALDRIRALHRDPAGRALVPTLLAEGERWGRRIELIRDGVIGLRQIVARRRDRGRL
jgi:cyclopropane fatty-acyl-phospholipid synthase-like methyltransferase